MAIAVFLVLAATTHLAARGQSATPGDTPPPSPAAARPAAQPAGEQSATPSAGQRVQEPADLAAAAALAFAEAVDDGSAAFCAPGRYTVTTLEGPQFAMVSWGDRVALTLLDDEVADSASNQLRAALTGDPPTIELVLTPAASGARYTAPMPGSVSGSVSRSVPGSGHDGTSENLFWTHGRTARIELNGITFQDARVDPLSVDEFCALTTAPVD